MSDSITFPVSVSFGETDVRSNNIFVKPEVSGNDFPRFIVFRHDKDTGGSLIKFDYGTTLEKTKTKEPEFSPVCHDHEVQTGKTRGISAPGFSVVYGEVTGRFFQIGFQGAPNTEAFRKYLEVFKKEVVDQHSPKRFKLNFSFGAEISKALLRDIGRRWKDIGLENAGEQ